VRALRAGKPAGRQGPRLIVALGLKIETTHADSTQAESASQV